MDPAWLGQSDRPFDPPLTDRGIRQAKALGVRLRELSVRTRRTKGMKKNERKQQKREREREREWMSECMFFFNRIEFLVYYHLEKKGRPGYPSFNLCIYVYLYGVTRIELPLQSINRSMH